MNLGKFFRRKIYIDYLDEYVRVYKNIPIKKTARCPKQLVLEDSSYNKYLLVLGRTEIEKFYINRSIEVQKKYCEKLICAGFDVNMPLAVWEKEDRLFVLYDYYERYFFCKGNKPKEIIEKFVDNNSEEIEINDISIKKIEENFLTIFPQEYAERIKKLPLYKEYFKILSSMSKIKVCFEHGDYATNNILITNQGRFFLMDFEFATEYQPVGFDLYTYMRTIGQRDESIINYELSQKREKLKEKINDILDEEFGKKK